MVVKSTCIVIDLGTYLLQGLSTDVTRARDTRPWGELRVSAEEYIITGTKSFPSFRRVPALAIRYRQSSLLLHWMRSIYRFVLLLLLVFMFRSPLLRLHQTASHLFGKTSTTTQTLTKLPFSTTVGFKQNNDTMSDDRPSGLIAKSGLELLTFGTPNGASRVANKH